MKPTIIKTSLIFQLFIIIGTGCKKEPDNLTFYEISNNSETKTIQEEIDNIEFKFCLLNEQNEPATTFNKGENFSFCFTVTNNKNEKLYFDPFFAYSKENDFFRVFNSNNQDIGKPFVFLGYDKVGIGAYPFGMGKSYTFIQQWTDSRDSIWNWQHGYYKRANQQPLTADRYYTDFRYQFEFDSGNSESLAYKYDIRFKIYFEIR